MAMCGAWGRGRNTWRSQIAAEALHLPYENVSMAPPDTMEVPNSGPTVASRTAMVVGKLVESAARKLKSTLRDHGLLGEIYTPEEFRDACRKYVSAHGQFRSFARYEQPSDIFWDDQHYRGAAYAAFSWAVY